ncbi:MAG: hypothetical protein OEZ06_26560 [Myxococcales bacterium]|nr:hypothetical protein [Myxococcales bacterium]
MRIPARTRTDLEPDLGRATAELGAEFGGVAGYDDSQITRWARRKY